MSPKRPKANSNQPSAVANPGECRVSMSRERIEQIARAMAPVSNEHFEREDRAREMFLLFADRENVN